MYNGTLFFHHDQALIDAGGVGGEGFGTTPIGPDLYEEYANYTKRISLKNDLGWQELSHLQQIFKNANIWEDFPATNFTLVCSEKKVGDENQRIDLLYLRDDGALLPCELKIGGGHIDVHGQLIRYLSDLYYQEIDYEWIRFKFEQFLNTVQNGATQMLHESRFETFCTDNRIDSQHVRVLPRTGLLIDENYHPATLKAIRYLNDYCSFFLRLIELKAFVADEWETGMPEYYMRLDLVEVW